MKETVLLGDLKDWRFTLDLEGIAWAVFDREGESANSLGRRPLEELMRIVGRVERDRVATSWPKTLISPRVGRSARKRRRISDVLPAPEGPVRNWKEPRSMEKEMSRRISGPIP